MSYRYIDDIVVARELGLAGPRDRTAHIHTLRGKPLFGASTINGYAKSAEGLHQYHADRAAVSALAMPPIDILDEYEAAQNIQDWREKKKAMAALDKKYPSFAEARRAAERHKDSAALVGTARHGKLEDYIRECMKQDGVPFLPTEKDEYAPEVWGFIKWANANIKYFIFAEANAYSEKLWTGGIADLGFILKDGRRAIGDHKSSKSAYKEQFRQAGLYDILLTENGGLTRDGEKVFDWEPADCAIIFPFRSDPFTPEIIDDMKTLRMTAEYVCALYRWNEKLTPKPM